MKSDVIVLANKPQTELSAMTTEQLRERLASALRLTAEGIAEMASIVRELEQRGDDLSGFRLAILPYLRRVADGSLLPEIIVSYAGTPTLLAAIATIPVADQRQLLDTGAVTIAVVEHDGTIGSRKIDPRALPKRDIPMVFRPDGIASPKDQLAGISKRLRGRRQSPRISIDRANRVIIAGRTHLPIADVLTALSHAAGWGGEIDKDLKDCPTAAAKLLPEEKERLRALAKATGLAEWELVRRAILAWLV